MFETVSTEALIRSHRKLWYETLPVSLAVHLIGLGLAVGVALNRTTFPDQAPHLMFAYSVANLNPAPPPPPPPPPRSAADPVKQSAPVPDDKIVAPTVIPDTIPDVRPVDLSDLQIASSLPNDAGVPAGVPNGDPVAGVPGGILGGQPKGVLGGILEDDGKVHFQRDSKLPMFIERQEYPAYPEEMRSRGIEEDVVVHYTIDKEGKVRGLFVVEHPKHKEFEYAAVDAIKGWRFKPLIVDGEPLEVVHELTVYFRLR